MNLGEVLEGKFPGMRDAGGYSLMRDPDTGEVRFGRWDEAIMGRVVPTEAELQAARLPALKEHKVREIRSRLVAEAEALMPVYEYIYVTRARINDPRTSQLEALARKARDLEARVGAARTKTEVEAVAW